MLSQLTIKNYALIHQLEMVPSAQLTVITGETGAGKSIMLGAIGLLLGNRADTKVLWDESEKCITEGTFEISSYGLRPLFEHHNLDYSDQTVIRREISTGGKSRAFINDTPVTLDVMRDIGGRLMDVHSQHETLELGTHRFQLALVDSYTGNLSIVEAYQKAWKEFTVAEEAYNVLSGEAGKLKAEYDFIKFQVDELQQASLKEPEQEELESSLKISEHAEDIKSRLHQILALLGQEVPSAQGSLSAAVNLLQPIRDFSPALEQLSKRLEIVRIELKDIVDEAESAEERVEVDPARRVTIQERLDLVYTLLQKHRLPDIKALLELQRQLEEQASKTANVDADLLAAGNLLDKARSELKNRAGKLTVSREKGFAPLSSELVKLLRPLGIPEAVLKIEHTETPPGPRGADLVEVLFSANKGIAPRPLEAVASGGEFSRLMFCVKYVLAEKSALPTLVLDEIDTGVSGEIAMQLGLMMKEMAKRHQLIAISHLPQIAVRGDKHFLVFKDSTNLKTSTEIKILRDEERVDEVAKMIGGAKPSTLARENARELLQQ
ncbi:MAG: DNA repair protein RecN [Cytophagales bacterium]|nr:DNA repair protein RecN [Cytophagales bacterium]